MLPSHRWEIVGSPETSNVFPRESRGHELWKDFVETTRLATWFYVMDSWRFFPTLMISCDDLYETISLMEYQLLLLWIPSHTWPFRNSVENLGVGFVLQTVQPLTFPWLGDLFAPGFAFRGVKKTPPSVALRFRWGVSTENHHRRYQWILPGKEWKLLGVGKILPSLKLT